jgi:hypothetical protein
MLYLVGLGLGDIASAVPVISLPMPATVLHPIRENIIASKHTIITTFLNIS